MKQRKFVLFVDGDMIPSGLMVRGGWEGRELMGGGGGETDMDGFG
jgi:hypothetical protein